MDNGHEKRPESLDTLPDETLLHVLSFFSQGQTRQIICSVLAAINRRLRVFALPLQWQRMHVQRPHHLFAIANHFQECKADYAAFVQYVPILYPVWRCSNMFECQPDGYVLARECIIKGIVVARTCAKYPHPPYHLFQICNTLSVWIVFANQKSWIGCRPKHALLR
jgi:hypothetical protein